jgi:peptide/nickel transport system permease protein
MLLLAGEDEVFWNAFSHIILPASILGYASMAYISRMTRSFMLEQLGQEYIVAARVRAPSRVMLWSLGSWPGRVTRPAVGVVDWRQAKAV